jgi:hypothetical protein
MNSCFRNLACSLRLFRLPSFLCCLLTFWACVDSQAMLLIAPGSSCSTPNSSSPLQQDDDDLTVEQAGFSASLQVVRRHMRRPTQLVNKSYIAPAAPRSQLPRFSTREHEKRNGIGAPLLC